MEFNDYVQPNLALAQGSLDANFFQHRVYLQKFAADQKLDLVELVQGPIAPWACTPRPARPWPRPRKATA